jgi:chain length determinant protein EpsF
MTFQQFFLLMKARWKLALKVFLVIVGLTIIGSLVWPKRYTATASVVLDMKSTDPVLGALLPIVPGYVSTQIDIISSDRVARRVATNLKLAQNPDIIEQWRNDMDGQGDIITWLGELLQKYLDVRPSRDSNVININFTGSDPKFAAVLANAFAQTYLETNVELKVDPAKQYASWFNQRTQVLRSNLEKAQAKLTEYQRKNGVVATDDRLDVETARLQELATQLAVAQAQRADAKSRNSQASGRMDVSPDVLQNPVIQALKADVARQEAKVQELGAQLGRNHPQYQSAVTELNTLKAKLDSEMRLVAASVGTASAVSQQREGEIQAAVDAQKKKVLEFKTQHDELTVLKKDFENAQRAYELVNGRLSETSLESESQQTNVAILTPAVPPIRPSSPKLLLNTVLAIFLGGLIGVGTVLLLEMKNRRVRSTEDLYESLGVPVLAVVTETRMKPRKRLLGFRRAAALPS